MESILRFTQRANYVNRILDNHLTNSKRKHAKRGDTGMKQLELFSPNPTLQPLVEYTEVSPSLAGKGTCSDESDKCVDSGLDQERLAHYRNKLAKLDVTGYQEVAEIITSDTIHRHNQLARDMKIVGALRQMQWSTEAIGNYFLTRRIKNRRPQ